MKMPCEIVIWYILPAIRRELTRSLVEEFGRSQRETAHILKLTDAAVSQYLSDKRGKLVIKDAEILEKISIIAKQITEGKEIAIEDFCRICVMMRRSPEVNKEFAVSLLPCAMDETELLLTEGESADINWYARSARSIRSRFALGVYYPTQFIDNEIRVNRWRISVGVQSVECSMI